MKNVVNPSVYSRLLYFVRQHEYITYEMIGEKFKLLKRYREVIHYIRELQENEVITKKYHTGKGYKVIVKKFGG